MNNSTRGWNWRKKSMSKTVVDFENLVLNKLERDLGDNMAATDFYAKLGIYLEVISAVFLRFTYFLEKQKLNNKN